MLTVISRRLMEPPFLPSNSPLQNSKHWLFVNVLLSSAADKQALPKQKKQPARPAAKRAKSVHPTVSDGSAEKTVILNTLQNATHRDRFRWIGNELSLELI